MKIAVIGMGKIGLPLAVQYAQKGHDVFGVDINDKTIDLINKGLEPFPEEENLQKYLHAVVKSKKLKATSSYEEAVSNADAIVVVVPLFVNEKAEPDFTAMESATREIAKHLKKQALVCYETTLPIGTTRKRLTPLLEQISRMKVGDDFFVVFSPERVLSGQVFRNLRMYPKIVGGVTKKCSQKGIDFYKKVIDFDVRVDLNNQNGVWSLESSESAEFVKLAETTYRDVNISLANQFAMHADFLGVDIYEIINAANTQNFSQIHQPGISVGGHCIPVYPHLYAWTDRNATLVQTSREVNFEMPTYCFSQIKSAVKDLGKKTILILGLSYRENIKSYEYSGVFKLIELFEEIGSKVLIHDPYYSNQEILSLGFLPLGDSNLDVHLILLHTKHRFYREFNLDNFGNCELVFDGRNFTKNWKNTSNVPIIVLGGGNLKNLNSKGILNN